MTRTENVKAYTEAMEQHLLAARETAAQLLEAVEAYIVHLDDGTIDWGHVGSLEHATGLMEQAMQALGVDVEGTTIHDAPNAPGKCKRETKS